MLEGIKPKSVIISSLTDSSDTGHSKLIYIDGKDSKDMARNDSKTKSEVTSTNAVEPASEALEEEDGSDVMEDAISDVTSSTPGSDRDGSEEPNGSSSKKRVHFADDTDSTAIFRSASTESLTGNKDATPTSTNGPRSNLRKRASSNVNPRPAHLARKHRDTFQGEQLHITPAESLEFVVMDFQKETLDIINLKNITEQVITYKVKTTAPEKYRVRPSTGLIQPGAAVDVNVYLPPGMHSTNRDKFLIMSLVVDDPQASEKGINELNDLWKSSPKDDIVEHRIRCVLIDQSQSSFADEAVAKEVGEIKELMEKNNTFVGNLRAQINDMEDSLKWNQLFLKLACFVLLFVLFLCYLNYKFLRDSSTRNDQQHCHNAYSSSSATEMG